jgi:hypothetical protein
VWFCYFKPDVIKQEFQLPDEFEPINILVVDYSDEEPADTDNFDRTCIQISQMFFAKKSKLTKSCYKIQIVDIVLGF